MRKQRANEIRTVARKFYMSLTPEQRLKRTFKNVYRNMKRWYEREGTIYA